MRLVSRRRQPDLERLRRAVQSETNPKERLGRLAELEQAELALKWRNKTADRRWRAA